MKRAEKKPETKKEKKRKINPLLIALVIIVSLLVIILVPLARKPKENYVKINDNTIKIEIADSIEEQTKGLMFRKSLDEKTGMLFIFDQPGILTFWMKNMNFPLDMIYIDENMQIVTIIRNAQPCQEDPCTIHRPEQPARYVLEINGGDADKIGIKEGDIAEIKIK